MASADRLQAIWIIVLFQHMSLAIITPRKALGSILTVPIPAQKPATGSGSAVAACHMPVQIARPVEPLGTTARDVASELTAVGLEMLTA